MLKKSLRLIPALFLIFTLVYRVDYRIDAPGGITPLESFITFENGEVSEADLNSVYIMTFNRPTIFQWIVAQFFESVDVVKLSERSLQVTNTARFESGQVARNTAIQKAIITAYESLGVDITYETWWLVYLKYDFVDASIEIGDRILSVNGNTEVIETLSNVACDETAELIIQREDETLEMTLNKDEESCLFGISISEYTHITSIGLEYESEDSFIGGPSAGLMNTLYIYDALNDDFALDGLKIAGTGTINMDTSVGSVGAIKQKIFTVLRNEVDVFFVPSGRNYEEALAIYETLNDPGFDLVEVDTFDQVITYLEALYEDS